MLAKITSLENAYLTVKLGLCLGFFACIYAYVLMPHLSSSYLLVFAAVTSGYIVINIGVNDIANNVGAAESSNTDVQRYKQVKKRYKKELVKRLHLYKIATARIITVRISGLGSAGTFYILKAING